ncbi:MAG: dinitrogenase reductase, partial [Bacteroidales bacterium]|nr:dinitrogenase reductase [Bacteroidales bacterium]
MIGAIAGDIIGSTYEWNNVKTTSFKLFTSVSDFTDDTVLTMAVADCILHNLDFSKTLWEYGRRFYGRGYGSHFKTWLRNEVRKPYNSFGNGAAMRVSPIGFAYDNLEKVLKTAKMSAEVTHNHPEGIKGAQAIAAAVFLANIGKTKQEIKHYIQNTFFYDL